MMGEAEAYERALGRLRKAAMRRLAYVSGWAVSEAEVTATVERTGLTEAARALASRHRRSRLLERLWHWWAPRGPAA